MMREFGIILFCFLCIMPSIQGKSRITKGKNYKEQEEQYEKKFPVLSEEMNAISIQEKTSFTKQELKNLILGSISLWLCWPVISDWRNYYKNECFIGGLLLYLCH